MLQPSLRKNLPESFINNCRQVLPESEVDELINAINSESPTSIRTNNKVMLKPSTNKVPWCEYGFYLDQRPLFTADPQFHAGAYYVQEASSMLLFQVVKQFFPEAQTVLDLCAAPGGKSTLLLQALPVTSLLVCNEIVRSRAHILTENIIKWGNHNVVVTNNRPNDFENIHSFFDAIVVDAPCSGEGMFRKDSGAIDEWSVQNVTQCAQRQKDIITDIWGSLKEGGILVYSTCTYNIMENEDNIEWIIEEFGAEYLQIDISSFEGVVQTQYGNRCYPHKVLGEGFFISALRKTSGEHAPSKRKFKNTITTIKNFETNLFDLQNKDDFTIYETGNQIKCIEHTHHDELVLLSSCLQITHFGILFGERKNKDFVPDISIALSKQLSHENARCIDLDKETAILYLKKEAIQLSDCQLGYLIVRHDKLPLGWVKNIGNRCNNLYPPEWRIRSKNI